jgi:hypothetical protein
LSLTLTVHRGAQQMGGSCIEIAHPDGERLILDAGRPLDAGEGATGLLPRRSKITYPSQPSPIPISRRPAHRPFRDLLSVHSRCGLHVHAKYKCQCFPQFKNVSALRVGRRAGAEPPA